MERLGAATEVEAVSELLAVVGEDPVESLEDLPPSGNIALTTLRNVSRDFQEEGHWFNQETDYQLTPDAHGFIAIPEIILDIDGMDADVIQRGNKLYDRVSKTPVFTGPVACDVTFHLPWSDLPSVVRRYIIALSIEKFVDSFPAADGLTEARNRNLIRAKVAFEKATVRNADYNLLNNSHISQKNRRG